jgi:integrase
LVEAIHASRDLLERLRAERAATGPQLSLPIGGHVLERVIPEFLKERKWRSVGGERWTRETCDLLRKELGKLSLADLTVDALWAYRDERRKVIGPNAMQSRLIVLAQILAWSSEPPRKWLPFVPPMPSPKVNPDERITTPSTKWIDHPSFRATRARIYEHQTARNGLAVELRQAGLPCDAAAVRDLVERRKLYLSFAFYTGMRRHDLDEIDDSYLSIDFDCYFRHGRKTGVDVAAEAIPKPFKADVLAELRRLGRPFRSGERIAGGPWKNSCRVLETAARNAEVSKFNLRDCRRSFVYYKAMGGVEESKLVNLLGHADSEMIHNVYLLLQPRLQRDEAGAAWFEDVTVLPGTGDARILTFPPK